MCRLATLFSSIVLVTVLTVTVDAQIKVDLNTISEMKVEAIREKLNEGLKQYETQLQAVLKTRLPEEQDFVGQIVLLVQAEQIPKNLVDSAWLWVRNNRANTPYPFVYFERVLRLQATKLKVVVPKFDREVYNNRTADRNRRQNLRRR